MDRKVFSFNFWHMLLPVRKNNLSEPFNKLKLAANSTFQPWPSKEQLELTWPLITSLICHLGTYKYFPKERCTCTYMHSLEIAPVRLNKIKAKILPWKIHSINYLKRMLVKCISTTALIFPNFTVFMWMRDLNGPMWTYRIKSMHHIWYAQTLHMTSCFNLQWAVK